MNPILTPEEFEKKDNRLDMEIAYRDLYNLWDQLDATHNITSKAYNTLRSYQESRHKHNMKTIDSLIEEVEGLKLPHANRTKLGT